MKFLTYITLTVSICSSLLNGHDTFLRSDEHYLGADESATVYILNGNYKRSLITFTASDTDRFILASRQKTLNLDPSIIQSNDSRSKFWKVMQVADGFLGGIDNRRTSTFHLVAPENGTSTVAWVKKPARGAFDEAKHISFLQEEAGLNPDAYPYRPSNNRDHVIHKYIMIAKSVFQFGPERTENVTKPMGLHTEVVPLMNPASVKVGDTMNFLLLFDNLPAPNAVAVAKDPNDSKNKIHLISSEEGIISMPITEPGEWWIVYIRCKPMHGEDDIDYLNWMTSLTFQIQ